MRSLRTSVRERAVSRNRLTWHLPGQRRITRRARKLSAAECRAVEERLRAEGIWRAATKGADNMPWGPEERNRNSLSPYGQKAMQGHGGRAMHDQKNSVACAEMGSGLLGAPLNPDPHGAGPRMPVHIAPSSSRPRDEPAATTVPHNPNPHPYNPASQVQQKNTYAHVRGSERGDTPAHERRERRREGE
jgi:hypothetical protein